jgi:hypothetical protein
MYKQVAQLKLRFPYKGQCDVEDLFDLGLADLDRIYKVLKQEQGDAAEGLLQKRTHEDEVLALKLGVVEDVFQTKQAEIEARQAAADRKARKERIMEIIADKQDAALMDKPLEELQEMLDAL